MANILILDDDTITVKQLSKLITSFGHNPIPTTNPNQLIQILESNRPDLILMDVNMPDIDGLTLLKQVKAAPAYREIPVVMLTGDTDERLLANCFIAGAMDFINKPLNKTVLQSRLQSTLKIQDFIDKLKLSKMQAEDATKLKDKFVSLVSHDLRGPIGSIISVLEMVQNNRDTREEKNKMVGLAIDSGKEMMALIEDLLNVGKLKTGKLKPEKDFIDARLFAMKAKQEFDSIAGQKGIEIINSVPELSRIHADVILFYEVIRNLVSNAVKFCHKGDAITLFIPEGEKTVIAVSDTGVGIKPGRLGSLFKYEEKTSTRGTSGEAGTGLGLPLCRDIMEAHGGSLTVESVEGKGSTFFARLPAAKPVILVVEDELIDRRLIVGNINKIVEVKIIEAEDGKRAKECFGKITPDLVITDINMPEMDGFELLEFIKNNSKTENIPVIVVTRSIDIAEKKKAFQLGADDFVTKPLVLEDFIPRVGRFLS